MFISHVIFSFYWPAYVIIKDSAALPVDVVELVDICPFPCTNTMTAVGAPSTNFIAGASNGAGGQNPLGSVAITSLFSIAESFFTDPHMVTSPNAFR